MNDDNGKLKPEEKEEKPKELVLTITLKCETGEIVVQGPGNGKMFDEPICDYLMKKASRHIEMSNIRASQSQIIRPRPSIKDIFPRRGH